MLVSLEAVVAVIGISKLRFVSLLRPKTPAFLFELPLVWVRLPTKLAWEEGDRLLERPDWWRICAWWATRELDL